MVSKTTAIILLAGIIATVAYMWVDLNTTAADEQGRSGNGRQYGILGRQAPDLNLTKWIDAAGNAAQGPRLSDLRGKVVYLYFFQHWCPGCHAHGFPTLQTIAQAFKDDSRVAVLALQTAFEGKHVNTLDKLRKNQIDYDLAIPMGHDGGSAGNPRGLPQTMIDYRSGGTPWTVIIDPDGKVVYNQFHIDALQAVDYIKSLRRDSYALKFIRETFNSYGIYAMICGNRAQEKLPVQCSIVPDRQHGDAVCRITRRMRVLSQR